MWRDHIMERRPITVTIVTVCIHQRPTTDDMWLSFTRSSVSTVMKSMVVSHALRTLHSFASTWQQPIMNMCVISVGTCLHLARACTDIRQNIASVGMCVSCDRDFPTLSQCQAHMSSHVSRIGACSPYDTPSQRQHTMLWHTLLYRHKPWQQDVRTIVGAGHLQDRINTHYQQLRGGIPQQQHRLQPAEEENLRVRAYQNVVSQYEDRLRDFYANNLRQYVNHTTTRDGRIEKFNINLLGRRGFLWSRHYEWCSMHAGTRFRTEFRSHLASFCTRLRLISLISFLWWIIWPEIPMIGC